MKFGTRLSALVVAATSAALLTGGPALASSSHHGQFGGRHHHVISGPEFISGSLSGPGALATTPVIPLKLRGIVPTFALFPLPSGNVATIPTQAGNLTVRLTNKVTTSSFNHFTCVASQTVAGRLIVLPFASGGAFRGARGSGNVSVYFTAVAPRFPNGRCNFNGTPVKAFVSLRAFLFLILRR